MRAAAKKAPDAVFLPLDMATYEDASSRVMGVLAGFGDALEVWGWDEAYLGIEGREASAVLTLDDVAATAHRIRQAVLDETGLHSCVGISDNKQRAKAATGFAKHAVRDPAAPPQARVFVLDDDNWSTLMDDRPCRDLWSVGSRTAAKLAAVGVDSVAQLVATDRDQLIAMFGPHQGNWLYVLCRGGGDDAISDEPPIAKSHSRARTFDADLTDRNDLLAAVRELTAEVLEQVIAEGRTAFRVGLTVRTASFYTRTKMRKLTEPTTASRPITEVAAALLDAFEIEKPIRLMAVRLELLDPLDADADGAGV